MKKQYLGTIIILSICLILSLFYNFRTGEINSKYESYLSQELSNMVANFASKTIESNKIIEKVIAEKVLFYDDLLVLGANFHITGMKLQDVKQMNFHLKAVDLDAGHDLFVRANVDISDYFNFPLRSLYSNDSDRVKHENKEKITLSSDQITTLITIKKLLDEYTKIIIENIPGIDGNGLMQNFRYTRSNFITNDGWKKLLQRINEVTTSEYLIR